MKPEVSVPELVEVFKEIQKQPEQIFEMIRLFAREIQACLPVRQA